MQDINPSGKVSSRFDTPYKMALPDNTRMYNQISFLGEPQFLFLNSGTQIPVEYFDPADVSPAAKLYKHVKPPVLNQFDSQHFLGRQSSLLHDLQLSKKKSDVCSDKKK
jgi:hypothetical protein